jgi:molybdate transport system permease protein
MPQDLSSLWISLKTSVLATAIAFVAGTLAAYGMYHYRGRGKGVIDGILTLPLVLPPTVVGFLLLLLLGRNSPIGQLLRQLGMSVIFTWQGAVIAATVVAFPLMYKTVLGSFEQVDSDLVKAARTLGANSNRIFWQILLPLAWRGVVAGTILSFARALGEFGATLMLAGSIPGQTQTMPIAIFFAAEGGEMQEALIWVLLMVGIALGSIAAINHYSSSGTLSRSRYRNQWSSLVGYWVMNCQGSEKTFPETSGKGLWVDIRKKLPSFNLEVAFTSDRTPLGILGSSGSGKSMTLRHIAGLETPDAGQIILNGRVLFDSQKGINLSCRQRRIGVVFQNYALFPHLTVAQNIAFALQDVPKRVRQQRIQHFIALVELEGLENRYPHQLSGGQQQRVALARALAIQPEALLFDEPLSALDTYLRHRIEQLLGDVLKNYQGVSLFVTHKLEEAYRICQNLLILSQGKIVARGRKEDIFEHPPNYVTAQVTECKNFSRAEVIDAGAIAALDWNCALKVIEPIAPQLSYVGIRAHHLKFSESEKNNTFPCWLAATSETQHRVTLYLKLHQPPKDAKDYHLQGEVYKEKWQELKNCPAPWHVYLDPLKLILKFMKISTRNVIKGKVIKVEIGAVNAEVILEVSPGVELAGIITKASAERLGLSVGQEAYALIKASDVMFGID